MLLVLAVHDGRAAHFSLLRSFSVERPAADLLAADDVFDEENALAETQTETVEDLDVLQQVVVRTPARERIFY